MPDNVRRRRLQGKCNREIPPAGRLCARLVRVERQCKRLPFLWQQRKPCKPHPKQDRIENHVAARHVFRLVAGGHWRQCHWIDDYTRHNPAYRSASLTVQPGLCICCTDRMKTQSLRASGSSRSDFQWPDAVTVPLAELLPASQICGRKIIAAVTKGEDTSVRFRQFLLYAGGCPEDFAAAGRKER